jgi:serine/threonine-protein phosphatase 2A regulatory subunit B
MHDDDNDDNDDDDDRLFFPGQWRFSQCFGDKGEPVEVSEGINVGTNIWDVGDLISALAFDRSGSFLASGDRAGRVVLFERNAEDGQSAGEYRFYTEFQSHEAEFDYLKSLEINERINRIEWWSTPPQQDALFLLSTNGIIVAHEWNVMMYWNEM